MSYFAAYLSDPVAAGPARPFHARHGSTGYEPEPRGNLPHGNPDRSRGEYGHAPHGEPPASFQVPEASPRTLGAPAPIANKFDQCTPTQRTAILAAFERARRFVNQAEAILGTAYGKGSMTQRTRHLLTTHFHTSRRDDVLEILRNTFRIGQAIREGLKFECETNCGGGGKCGYAWATQWFGGYGDIHVCFDSRAGACSFARLNAQEQAALIIHEAAHRHVGIDDKAYVWEHPGNSKRDYSRLTAKQAMDNADSYAWFCVDVWPPATPLP